MRCSLGSKCSKDHVTRKVQDYADDDCDSGTNLETIEPTNEQRRLEDHGPRDHDAEQQFKR